MPIPIYYTTVYLFGCREVLNIILSGFVDVFPYCFIRIFGREHSASSLAFGDGDLEAVKYIIERWEVDVQAYATYIAYYPWPEIFTNIEKVRGATPLFVAASRGYPEIVRYLIGKRADVSVKTSTESEGLFAGLTPLHGAIIFLLPILDYTIAEENDRKWP